MRFGITNYVLRVGPSTLVDAKAFCATEGMTLYKPKNREAIHRLIFSTVSKYGATTFWTQSIYEYKGTDDTKYTNLQKTNMKWM